MKPFTVFFTHNLPKIGRSGGGVAAFHCSLEMAEDEDKAAISCRGSLGGYATIIAVLAGHHTPVLKGETTHVWANKDKYRTEEIKVTNFLLQTKT